MLFVLPNYLSYSVVAVFTSAGAAYLNKFPRLIDATFFTRAPKVKLVAVTIFKFTIISSTFLLRSNNPDDNIVNYNSH